MTLVRKLAEMVYVYPTRGDLARKLGERFHTLERSRWRATKTHDDHALHWCPRREKRRQARASEGRL